MKDLSNSSALVVLDEVIDKQYIWLMSEYQLCTNLHTQEQLAKMTSQCQYLAVMSQYWVSLGRP